jgi:hypothetical protein
LASRISPNNFLKINKDEFECPYLNLWSVIRNMAKKYGEVAQESVEKAMHKMKRGQLKSGQSGKTVKTKEQAVAIGLSEARKKGAKVPPKKN